MLMFNLQQHVISNVQCNASAVTSVPSTPLLTTLVLHMRYERVKNI